MFNPLNNLNYVIKLLSVIKWLYQTPFKQIDLYQVKNPLPCPTIEKEAYFIISLFAWYNKF